MELTTSWMEEGRQAMVQENILDVLEARFHEVPYQLRERILAIRNEAELKRLLRRAVLAPSLQKFGTSLKTEV